MNEATSKRTKFPGRTIHLRTHIQLDSAFALLKQLPLDDDNPIEVVIREHVKARKVDQNKRMWAGTLRDIAEQAWVSGRQFAAEVWHEYFKREYLPDDAAMRREELAELVKDADTYHKWSIDPSGNRVLVGSTTQLSIRGFSLYMHQVEAHGGNLGVHFSAAPGER